MPVVQPGMGGRTHSSTSTTAGKAHWEINTSALDLGLDPREDAVGLCDALLVV
jgi:hypothetical protein